MRTAGDCEREADLFLALLFLGFGDGERPGEGDLLLRFAGGLLRGVLRVEMAIVSAADRGLRSVLLWLAARAAAVGADSLASDR